MMRRISDALMLWSWRSGRRHTQRSLPASRDRTLNGKARIRARRQSVR